MINKEKFTNLTGGKMVVWDAMKPRIGQEDTPISTGIIAPPWTKDFNQFYDDVCWAEKQGWLKEDFIQKLT